MCRLRHCLAPRQLILILMSLLMAICTHAAGLSCHMAASGTREEVKRQWGYLDKLKLTNDSAIKKKSKRLVVAIQNHLYENNVQFEMDPKNSSAILIKVLPKDELQDTHPLNRFATSLYNLHDGVRVEINPLKLKIDDAGALFSEEAMRLTLALDNVLDLKSDSFVGHELKHAYYYLLEKRGFEHVFMGYLKRKPGNPILQETYPDAFSLDEFPSYYYQIIGLIAEALKDPSLLPTVKQFLQTGIELTRHFDASTTPEVSKFVETYLQKNPEKVTIRTEGKYSVVKIETERYELELNFLKSKGYSETQLRTLAITRFRDLKNRTQFMHDQFKKALEMLEQDLPLILLRTHMSSGRNVIDVKNPF